MGLLIAESGFATPTQVHYLSGTGKDDTVDWRFLCSDGAKSGEWTTIPVPSCWEQEGFGRLSYGKHKANMSKESGTYEHRFAALKEWENKRINMVFEGVMTDTRVSINGQSAGPVHQGGFYRFKYDVTDLLKFGADNLLRVEVEKFSKNKSVNEAERFADYWVFGGIFRSVYLEILPKESIARTAINATADGHFAMQVHLNNIKQCDELECRFQTLEGKEIAKPCSSSIRAGQSMIDVKQQVLTPSLWTAETPNLYQVVVNLKSGGKVVHTQTDRFGFRTVEVREGDGIYVNGTKITLKGVNRHSFHPDSGRTLNEQTHIEDIGLIKEMNMNAVRMSHYPPDKRFLELCDEQGLYVLNELAGWQAAYDAEVGRKLVEELVVRDVNHPSIILWCNGNEGGWNPELDDDYAQWDLQDRTVIHTKKKFNGIDAAHYITYDRLKRILDGNLIFLPTEFLHGMYDGGSGASLDDYWKLMKAAPNCAGGFLWVFADEAVQNLVTGTLDTAGNFAPDGILGPYHEKEGSFFAVKEIWSPIQLADPDYFFGVLPDSFNGNVGIINEYDFINADQLMFEWELVDYPGINAPESGSTVMASGTVPGPSIAPSESGAVRLRLPEKWRAHDALVFSARDWNGKELWAWTWPIKKAKAFAANQVTVDGNAAVGMDDGDHIVLSAGGTQIALSKSTGMIFSLSNDGRDVSFGNGPALTAGSQTVSKVRKERDGDNYVVRFEYDGDCKYAEWTMLPSGWIKLEYEYALSAESEHMGISFDYPEAKVNGMKWLGDGPYRVWRNRMKGTSLNVWQKDYNDAVTGSIQNPKHYPEFKGFHADVRWAVIDTDDADISIVCEEESLFLRMFTPTDDPEPRKTAVAKKFPRGDISLMDGISAIGTKFSWPDVLGPDGQAYKAGGTYRHTVYFKFDAKCVEKN